MSVGLGKQPLGAKTFKIHQHAKGVLHSQRETKRQESPAVVHLRDRMKLLKAKRND